MLHHLEGPGDFSDGLQPDQTLVCDLAFNTDGVIICEQNTGVIFQQIKKRREFGQTRFGLDDLGDNELFDYVESSVNAHRNTTTFL